MRLQIETILDYHLPDPVEVLLAIEAAPMHDQLLVEDRLTIDGAGALSTVPGEDGVGRRTLMLGEGAFRARYTGTFAIERTLADPATLKRVARRSLPADAVAYLWPSRYCEADRLETFVQREFGELEGGARIRAMADWIYEHVDYVSGSSDEQTSAIDTFVKRQGVCRDYAHLLASCVRASGIPARLASVYAWQLDPPDFHAVVEAWLEGPDGTAGWHLFDATRLAPPEGFVRMAVGRDATDIAFMSVFGASNLNEQSVTVTRID